MTLPPIAIGGIGGSGTRLVAAILRDVGYHIGEDLGGPLDNLWFTLLMKRRDLWPLENNVPEIRHALSVFLNAMTTRQPWSNEDVELINRLGHEPRLHHPLVWRNARRDSLLRSPLMHHEPPRKWGWKEPNTHVFLPVLAQDIPELKYIHVMRHGLDMAVSNNQNQLAFWGPQTLGIRVERSNPKHSLRYWCTAHRRLMDTGTKMGNRFLLLNFDKLCESPEEHLPHLLDFIGADTSDAKYEELNGLVNTPASTGRRKWIKRHDFDRQDLELVESLGFSLS